MVHAFLSVMEEYNREVKICTVMPKCTLMLLHISHGAVMGLHFMCFWCLKISQIYKEVSKYQNIA